MKTVAVGNSPPTQQYKARPDETIVDLMNRIDETEAELNPEYAERLERSRQENRCQTRVADCTGGTADSCGVRMPWNR